MKRRIFYQQSFQQHNRLIMCRYSTKDVIIRISNLVENNRGKGGGIELPFHLKVAMVELL